MTEQTTPDIITRIVPTDIASVPDLIYHGAYVDITPLIPLSAGDDDRHSFRGWVQTAFDGISQTVNSPEYQHFKDQLTTLLGGVQDQDFLFDIEGTLTGVIHFEDDDGTVHEAYYADPWMMAVVEQLTNNKNRVGFWTTASSEKVAELKRAMPSGSAELRAVAREDFDRVIKAYQARLSGQLADSEVLGILQSVYPTATQETLTAGVKLFTRECLDEYGQSPTRFLQTHKFPQLFISPTKGFFVDNDPTVLKAATTTNWPSDRAIGCEGDSQDRQNALSVAQRIASAISVPQNR